jgi:hypothetical protein
MKIKSHEQLQDFEMIRYVKQEAITKSILVFYRTPFLIPWVNMWNLKHIGLEIHRLLFCLTIILVLQIFITNVAEFRFLNVKNFSPI